MIDSFKKSISSLEISKLVRDELLKKKNGFDINIIPIADGGEGTVEALTFNKKFIEKRFQVTGPYKDAVNSFYNIFDSTAYIEMCSASGFSALESKILSPYFATSYGTGELLKDAFLNKEVESIVLGIGGSLTNDCGAGMLQALGMKFSLKGKILGKDLGNIEFINEKDFLKGMRKKPITVLCDVDNPLLGENGATMVYAKQKGATENQIDKLEDGIKKFHKLTKNIIGKDLSEIPGTGAAGGMGYALLSFFDIKFVNGFDYMMNEFDLTENIKKSDLIITGEGKFDNQSFYGKPTGRIISLAKKYNKKIVLICGQSEIIENDICVYPISDIAIDMDDAMLSPEKYIKKIVKGLKL